MTKQQPTPLLEGTRLDEIISGLPEGNEYDAYDAIRALCQRVKVLEDKLLCCRRAFNDIGAIAIVADIDTALAQASEPSKGRSVPITPSGPTPLNGEVIYD